MNLKKYFNLVVGLPIIFILCLQLVAWFSPSPEIKINKPLDEILSTNIDGLVFKKLPLAHSRVAEILTENDLRFDDVFYGEYSCPDFTVSLYVSHWKPAKMPYDLAGYHSPDVCWSRTGWKTKKRIYAFQKEIMGLPLKPVEFGIYYNQGVTLEVVFWHLVGGKSHRYTSAVLDKSLTARLDRALNMFRDARSLGIGKPKEQLFIRLVSSTPYEDIWNHPNFDKLLKELGKLGIFQNSF